MLDTFKTYMGHMSRTRYTTIFLKKINTIRTLISIFLTCTFIGLGSLSSFAVIQDCTLMREIRVFTLFTKK